MQLTSYFSFECLLLYKKCLLCNVTQFRNVFITLVLLLLVSVVVLVVVELIAVVFIVAPCIVDSIKSFICPTNAHKLL